MQLVLNEKVLNLMHQSFELPPPPTPPLLRDTRPGHSLLLSVKCSESPALRGKGEKYLI